MKLPSDVLPRVAVCMAAYNGMRWIAEQIDSILGQAEVSVTLFVSVDLSTDGTYEYVVGRSLADDRIRVLDYGSRFGGAGKNFYRLIRDVPVLEYQYFSFSDQDDVWSPDKLVSALRVLQSGMDGYSSNVEAFWPDGKVLLIQKAQPFTRWDYLFEAAGPGCTYVFSRSLWLAVRQCVIENWIAVQNVVLHDWFCYAFARSNGFSWKIDNQSHMRYRQHGGNQVGMNHGLPAFIRRFRMFVANQWLSQSKLIHDIVGMQDVPFYVQGTVPGRKDLLKIVLKFRRCRRRFRDQILFLFFCLALLVIGWRDHGLATK
jgi:rhamnosyltransferase